MSDRCYLWITIRKADKAVVEEVLGLDDDQITDETETRLTFGVDEANYGWNSERQDLANRGIPFFGSHSAGSEYPGYAFAAVDGRMEEVADIGHVGYAVGISENGVSMSDVANAQAYFLALRLAKRAMGA